VPSLVVYTSGSPFRRTRRAEYRYPPVSVEAEEPVAPLLEPGIHDAHGLILVPDVYAVWPEVGGHRATSYREMKRLLEAYMQRSCSRRLPARLCSRIAYRAHPWMGEMGGWTFDARPGDATLYAALHVVEVLAEQLNLPRGRRASRVYTLYSEEQHPWQARLQELAAAAAAATLEAELVEAVQWPHPYPRGKTAPLIEAIEHRRLDASTALRRLLAEPVPRAAPLLKTRGPHTLRIPRRPQETAARLAAATQLARGCMLTALATAASTEEKPIGRLRAALQSAAAAYEDATALSKKRGGGRVSHGLEASHDAVVAALTGAALLHSVAAVLSRQGWRPGTPLREGLLLRIGGLLGCSRDATPEACIQSSPGGGRELRRGCLEKLASPPP